MNIWLSTTTGWNPGDEFIREALIGLINPVFAEAGIRHTYFNFCRNPDNDNSMFADGNRLDAARMKLKELRPKLVIHCGTPEWTGRRIAPLLKAAKEWDAPVVYLGVGSTGHRQFTDDDKKAVASCRLFVGRDSGSVEEALIYGGLHRNASELLPCPALLYPVEPNISAHGSLLIWQSPSGPQATTGRVDEINPHDYDMVGFHYIGDLVSFRREHPDYPIGRQFYNPDFRALANFIHTFKYVTTMRLHGGFVAMATAAEVQFLHHDYRTDGAVHAWNKFEQDNRGEGGLIALRTVWTKVIKTRLLSLVGESL